MENQDQVQAVDSKQNEKRLMALFKSVARQVFIALVFFLLLSLAGIVLGAINFVGPAVHYPSWLLAAWFVADVLVVTFILVHFAAYVIALFSSSNEEIAGGVIFIIVIIIAGAWILLANKHFAWVSICSFAILIAYTIIDTMLVLDLD